MAEHRRPQGYTGARDWQWRLTLGTALGSAGGVACVGVAMVSGMFPITRHLAATLAANAVLASACLAGAEEVVREVRSSDPEDAVNALLGGAISGYAFGAAKGGRALGLSSALAFSLLGLGLHQSVAVVQRWRLRQIHAMLDRAPGAPCSLPEESTSPAAGAPGAPCSLPDACTSAAAGADEARAKATDGSCSAREDEASGGGETDKTPLKWAWPEWLPIRPATEEDIKKAGLSKGRQKREQQEA